MRTIMMIVIWFRDNRGLITLYKIFAHSLQSNAKRCSIFNLVLQSELTVAGIPCME